MYTFLMDENKDLFTTVSCNLFQHESLVDKIQFLLPQTYQEFDLTDATVVLKYATVDNVARSEILTKDEELYKEKLRFLLPVDSELSRMAGTIKLRLTITKIDVAENKQYVLHSSETSLEIKPLTDYYAFKPDESLEFVDQMVGKLTAQLEAAAKLAEAYDTTKADNIVYEDDTLQLTANGKKIGDSVTIKSCDEDGVPVIDDGGDETDEELDSGSFTIVEI